MRLEQRGPRPGNERTILSKRPEYDSAIARCVSCLHTLASERRRDQGITGPIPFRAILAWAVYKRLDREMTDVLLFVIGQHESDRQSSEASKAALARRRSKP